MHAYSHLKYVRLLVTPSTPSLHLDTHIHEYSIQQRAPTVARCFHKQTIGQITLQVFNDVNSKFNTIPMHYASSHIMYSVDTKDHASLNEGNV